MKYILLFVFHVCCFSSLQCVLLLTMCYSSYSYGLQKCLFLFMTFSIVFISPCILNAIFCFQFMYIFAIFLHILWGWGISPTTSLYYDLYIPCHNIDRACHSYVIIGLFSKSVADKAYRLHPPWLKILVTSLGQKYFRMLCVCRWL